MEEGEGEVQVLEQEEQQQEQAEGARDLVGGGAMGERLVGTMVVVETPSSIPEVQGALVHAHRVALGLSPSAKAILICPLSSLSDPPPAPSAEATPAFSRMSRRPLQGAAGPSGFPPCQQPARSSSRPQGPAPGSGQGARLKTTPQAPAPAPSTGGSWQPPALPQGHIFGSVPAGVTLDCRKLSELHKKSGYRWDQRQHPYHPWNPTQEELWEAYHLIRGEGEWATLELVYLGAGDPRLKGQAASMRWWCPAPVVASCLPTAWTAGGTIKVRTPPAQAPSCAPVAFPLIMPAPYQSTWISNIMLRPSG